MNINLRDLHYFAVVAEHRHLSRAAEALGLSQPALSMSLRRLEQFMKSKLVKRTPKGVELTTTGEAVFAHARRLQISVEDISREVTDLSEGRAGYLRIGSGAGSAIHHLPAACAALLKEAPKATFKVITGARQATLKALSNGELDVLVTTIQTPRLESKNGGYCRPLAISQSDDCANCLKRAACLRPALQWRQPTHRSCTIWSPSPGWSGLLLDRPCDMALCAIRSWNCA
jgi:DNA-binding transcriptional LysR family regulator